MLIASTAVFFALSVRARADTDYTIHAVRPELHLSVGGHGDFGAGFRVDIPVVPQGFLRNGRDDFALSPGMDVQFIDFGDHHHGNAVLLLPQLAAQWNFYFPRGWSIFPEAGFAVVIGDWDGHDDVHVDPLLAFGFRRHFSSHAALVVRVGWPSGLQVGIAL